MEGLSLGFAIDLADRASFKAGRIKGSFNDLLHSITRTKQGMKDTGDSTGFFARMADRAKGSVDRLRARMGGLNHEGNRLHSTLSRVRGVLAAIGIVSFGALVTGQLHSIYNEGERVESQITQLETTLKSKTKAFEMLAWAQRKAVETPFEIPEINDAIVQLQAYNLDARKYFTLIGDMAAAMNQPLGAGVYAFARASIGNYEAMERFGINKMFVKKKADEMFGANVVASGEAAAISVKDYDKFLQALIVLMQDRFEKGMIRLSKTMVGIKSNILDSIGQIKRAIIGMPVEGTLYTSIKNTFQSIYDFFDRNQDKFEAFARVIGQALKLVWGYADSFVRKMIGWGQQFLDTTFDVSKGVDNVVYPMMVKLTIYKIQFDKVMSSFATGFKEGFMGVYNVVKTATGPIFTLIEKMVGLGDLKTDSLENTSLWIGRTAGVIVGYKVLVLLAGMVGWIFKLGKLVPMVKGLGVAFSFASKTVWGLGKALLTTPAGWITMAIFALIGVVTWGIDKLGGFRSAWEKVKGGMEITWEYIKWFGKAVWKVFDNLAKMIANFAIILSNSFSAAWELIKDIGGRLFKFFAGSMKAWKSLLSFDFEGLKSALSDELSAVFGGWDNTADKIKGKLMENTIQVDWNFGLDETNDKVSAMWENRKEKAHAYRMEYERLKKDHGGGVLGTVLGQADDLVAGMPKPQIEPLEAYSGKQWSQSRQPTLPPEQIIASLLAFTNRYRDSIDAMINANEVSGKSETNQDLRDMAGQILIGIDNLKKSNLGMDTAGTLALERLRSGLTDLMATDKGRLGDVRNLLTEFVRNLPASEKNVGVPDFSNWTRPDENGRMTTVIDVIQSKMIQDEPTTVSQNLGKSLTLGMPDEMPMLTLDKPLGEMQVQPNIVIPKIDVSNLPSIQQQPNVTFQNGAIKVELHTNEIKNVDDLVDKAVPAIQRKLKETNLR